MEVLWKEDPMYDDTKYTVLFPIITPPMARPPFIQDSEYFITVPIDL